MSGYRICGPAAGPAPRQLRETVACPHATATTKQTATTRAVLEQFGLLEYFDHVQGTDGFPAKPAPDVILKSLEVFGVEPEDCLLVGDAAADMEAGRRTGVKICAVTYGYGDRKKLASFDPDYWVDDLQELCPLDISSRARAAAPEELPSGN